MGKPARSVEGIHRNQRSRVIQHPSRTAIQARFIKTCLWTLDVSPTALPCRMTPDDFKFVSGLGADGELPETVNSNHGAQHIDHCFDYIQQGIRCAGQMDLEYAVRLGDTAFLAGEHHCKNWARAIMLYEKLEPDMGV
ncbi:hypothetical protein SCUP234_09995 [Seiridium cupressi]